MDREIVDRLTDILVKRFYNQGLEEFNLKRELDTIVDPVFERKPNIEEKEEIEKQLLKTINYKKAHEETILIPVSIVSDPRGHEEWYEDWLNENGAKASFYWKRQEEYLMRVLTSKYGPQEAARVIKSIDRSTNEIMKKIANPQRSKFSYKGLVLGYVQSGKTANFTALISKVADAGYKFIVVLAGIHNVLRKQTQIRLDKELTGMNDLKLNDLFIDYPYDLKSWHRMTSALDNGEFEKNYPNPFDYLCQSSRPALAVIKKNCRVMDKLIKYVRRTNETDLKNMPMLIIDDEADQASIDTNYQKDTDPSRTNEKIRLLLEMFPRKVYVGYTATPFANVLIDMTTEDEKLQDDIYPRNFIIALPEPDDNKYLGTSKIFASDLSNAFVEYILDEKDEILYKEIAALGLMRAIDEFVVCCAVRNIRGDELKPMSMLIHLTQRIDDMKTVKKVVDSYIETQRIKLCDSNGSMILKADLKNLWEEIKIKARAINEKLNLNNIIPEFENIWVEVGRIIPDLKIVELNSKSEDTLEYSTGEKIKVIAVGGNQLSRGLTLEGLMTSYYLRESKQYDTLLQMGRWFGYRDKYQDLTRIYTTEKIYNYFEHLALVEEELRSQIDRYEGEEKTPAEMAVAIRAHSKLKVTAKNKMGAAKYRQTSFSESLVQNIWVPLNDPNILYENYNLGNNYIRGLKESVGFTYKNGVYLAKHVSGKQVLGDFLEKYKFVDKESLGRAGLDHERLLEYIWRRMNDKCPELQKWNVGIVSIERKEYIESISYGGLEINRIERSRKIDDKGYNIGVITDKKHLMVDLDNSAETPYDGRSAQNPLLLLYLIWQGSRTRSPKRIDLFKGINSEKIDVLAVALVLPKSIQEPDAYIGQ